MNTGAEVTGGCELLGVGAGKEKHVYLTTEVSLQPHLSFLN